MHLDAELNAPIPFCLILTKYNKYDNILSGSAGTVGGCPPFRVKSFFGGNNFITFPSRLIRRVVLPMEYLVILVLLLIVATGYIEATKK